MGLDYGTADRKAHTQAFAFRCVERVEDSAKLFGVETCCNICNRIFTTAAANFPLTSPADLRTLTSWDGSALIIIRVSKELGIKNIFDVDDSSMC